MSTEIVSRFFHVDVALNIVYTEILELKLIQLVVLLEDHLSNFSRAEKDLWNSIHNLLPNQM